MSSTTAPLAESVTPPLRRAVAGGSNQAPLAALWRVLGSFWLALACFACLFLLVWLSTMEQRLPGEEGALVNVIERYFESWWVRADVTHALFGWEQNWFRLPLPGGLLVQAVLFVNLLVGGLIRMRWDRRRLGILIVHLSFAGMLIAGFVEFSVRDYGVLQMWEPAGVEQAQAVGIERRDRGRSFEHYTESEIAVVPRPAAGAETVEEVCFPLALWEDATIANAEGDEFGDRLEPSRVVRLEHDGLPFDLVVHHAMRNCRPAIAGPMVRLPAVDRVYLQPLEARKQTVENSPGCYVQVIRKAVDPATGEAPAPEVGILWQNARQIGSNPAWTVTVAGRDYGIVLRRKTLPLPFEVRLDDVVMAPHPGTMMAQEYSSHIQLIHPDGRTEKAHVTMNEPVVRGGYKFFQASWGPQDADPDAPHYTGLAVSRNPADRFWWYAVSLLAVGLGIHFLSKLQRYRAGQRRLLLAEQGGHP